MAKLTHEQAIEATAAAKTARKSAKEALEAFQKENKLKPMTDHSADKTHGKAWAKLKAAHTKARETFANAEKAEKELKPAKVRVTTYEYPKDVVTALDKKKYRATQRAAAKKAAKAADAPATEKAPKTAKAPKAEAPAPAAEAGAKKKKKAAPVED